MTFEDFKDLFVLIGISVTFIIGLLNLYYNRKNLKTSKYIETITSERIKWLEIIRNEYSVIASKTLFFLKLLKLQLKNKEEYFKQSEEKNHLENFYNAETEFGLSKKEKLWSTSEFIERLTLFKLRLNPKDDLKSLNILDYFIDLFLKKEFNSEKEIINAENKINELTKSIQAMLKNEWEKCKSETK